MFDANKPAEEDCYFESETDNCEEPEEIPFLSDPSYPTCSSSEILSSSDDTQDHDSSSLASFSSSFSSSSDDHYSDSDPSDPLAALENLTDYNTDNDIDDLEIVDIDLKTDSNDHNSSCENVTNSHGEVSEENREAFDNNVTEEGHRKTSTTGSLKGLLRKLSIRRKSSFKRSPRVDKRMSAVIGCYLSPSLLGMTSDDCQIDSSSWEFLDQSQHPACVSDGSTSGKDVTTGSTMDSGHHSDTARSQAISLRQSEHRISTLRLTECPRNVDTVEHSSNDDVSGDTAAAAVSPADTSEAVSENCGGHAFNAFNDSSDSAKSQPAAGQKSVSVSDRNLSSEASSGNLTVIKNYLRRLAAEETSILGQIVR